MKHDDITIVISPPFLTSNRVVTEYGDTPLGVHLVGGVLHSIGESSSS